MLSTKNVNNWIFVNKKKTYCKRKRTLYLAFKWRAVWKFLPNPINEVYRVVKYFSKERENNYNVLLAYTY
mgnify:FL=1